ncbi:MAG: hypothetical protein J1G01_03325 [Clostridiales bacterium]|nr:hypothetical protein [Clostridiales bacterium]
MTAFLSNVFNDPSDPWYYVLGVLFLVLIFGALAVYIIWSNNRKKKSGGEQETPTAAETDIVTEKPESDEAAEQTEYTAENAEDEQKQTNEKSEDK